jgi:hypothetical protein
MSLFGFGKRSRKRRSRRSSRRSRRVSRRRSRRSRRGSRRGSFERVGNKVHIVGKKGKTKVLKIKKDKDGREFYVSGKRKTKHFLEGGKVGKRSRRGSRRSRRVSRRRSRRSRRSRRVSRRRSRRSRRFGYMKNTLLNFMGNFQPAEMSLAQSTTGMSAPQMIRHMKGVPLSVRSNFYTNIV